MNTKMKVLSLALVGLCGFAGTAMAACPGSPVPPWTSVVNFQGAATIATGGYAGTECRLDSKLNAGASGVASAVVTYNNATPEPNYRAGFIVNVDSLANQSFTAFTKIFSVLGNDVAVEFYVLGDGSGGHTLSYAARSEALPAKYITGSKLLAAGENKIQFSLQGAGTASATFSLWVNGTDPNAPSDGPFTVDTTTLGPIKSLGLGLASPSAGFVTAFGGVGVGFDQFDSRRNTFIEW